MSETTLRPCTLGGGEPCLVCKEDIELERKIQELQDMRRRLGTRMNASHDPFTYKIPPEIASLIFSLSMEENDNRPLRFILCGLPTSFILGSVSQRWRQLARSTPQLWTTVSVTLVKQTKNGPVLPPLQFINDWLQLSGSLPLTLRIVDDATSSFPWETCRPIVDALNQHSGRWHKASLYLHKYLLLSYFRGTSSPSNLHDLEIGHTNNGGFDEIPTTYFSMNSRPSPTRLTIQAFSLSAIDVAWSNVTYLTLRWIPPHECIKAIKLAPLLESCTLSELDPPSEDHSFHSQQVFKHMRLRKLFLQETEVETLFVLNQAMEFPSLEELSYEVEGDFEAQSLISLLTCSGDRLKRLSLVMGPDSEEIAEGFIELLDAVPSLQNLECESLVDHTMNKFLQKLSSSPPMSGGIPGFLPKLQSLTLRPDSYPGTSTWGYIPRIFSWSHRKFLSLTVDTFGKIALDYDDRDEISQLIHKGFSIRIPRLLSESSEIQRENVCMSTVTGP